jgi:hypothetical protein
MRNSSGLHLGRNSKEAGVLPAQERSATQPLTHRVVCPLCSTGFDLLAAPWCGCDRGHPSKICPSCERCLCRHPDYGRAALWHDAPAALRRRGFDRLFIYYL